MESSQGSSNSSSGALPSEVFLQALTNEVNRTDVCKMVQAQKHMLTRFEKTNEMLLNFNSLSKARYEMTQNDFRKHTQLLTEMKRDLDTVFTRIRVLKGKLGKMYPEAFTDIQSSLFPVDMTEDPACGDVYNVLEEEGEEEQAEDGDTPLPQGQTLEAQGQGQPHQGQIRSKPSQGQNNQGQGQQSQSQQVRPRRPKGRPPVVQGQMSYEQKRQSWPPPGPRLATDEQNQPLDENPSQDSNIVPANTSPQAFNNTSDMAEKNGS